jgi:hypothetical protein
VVRVESTGIWRGNPEWGLPDLVSAPPNRAAEDFLPFTHPLSWTDPGQADRDEVSNLFSRPDSCNVWAPRNKMCA